MTLYILLLRGVMPSGKNKLSMARLRGELVNAGFKNPRTYIQSGNILVETDIPAQAIEKRVHDLIRDQLGPDLSVIARTGSKLDNALRENPFRDGYDISRVFFILFASQPPQEKVRQLLARDYSPEQLAFGPCTAYLYIPGQYGRGTLSNAFMERQLGVVSTMRNFNTLNRLLEMSRVGSGDT